MAHVPEIAGPSLRKVGKHPEIALVQHQQLAHHLRNSGQLEQALQHTLAAANQAEKALAFGAKVVTLSDSSGFVVDEAGIDAEKLAWIKALKNGRRGRIREYAEQFPGVRYVATVAGRDGDNDDKLCRSTVAPSMVSGGVDPAGASAEGLEAGYSAGAALRDPRSAQP